MSDLVLKELPIIGDIPGVPFIVTGILIMVMILFYPYGLRQIPYDIKALVKKLRKRGDTNV
jgi:branched-chain amino acid transport system permease protein